MTLPMLYDVARQIRKNPVAMTHVAVALEKAGIAIPQIAAGVARANSAISIPRIYGENRDRINNEVHDFMQDFMPGPIGDR